jgi:hypothetical protein
MAKKTGKTGRRTSTAAQKTALKREAARRKDIRNAKALSASKGSVRHAASHSPMSKKFASSQVDASRGHDSRTIRTGEENTFKEKQDTKKRDAARKKARTTEKTAKQKKAGSTERTAAQKKAKKKAKKRPTNRRKYGSV